MKNLIRIFAVSVLIFLTLAVQSQNRNFKQSIQERIIEAKFHKIRVDLQLDQASAEKLRPLYLKYEHEVANIDFKKLGKLMKLDADSLSTAEADQLIVNQLENARRLIDIREKYYKEFRTVLAPQKIIKLYQTEAELRRKVMTELKNRLQRPGFIEE